MIDAGGDLKHKFVNKTRYPTCGKHKLWFRSLLIYQKIKVMSEKKTKSGNCEQCENYYDEIMSFGEEIYRCPACMQTEGLCQNCGEYIPFPDEDDEDDPLWKLDDSSNYAPTLCLECFVE